MKNKEKLIELFVEAFDNLDSASDIVKIHNIYANENNSEDEVFENNDEFLDEYFEKPSQAVRAAMFGKYNYGDKYVWVNFCGNLKSSDYVEDMPIGDVKSMAMWFIDNYEKVADFDGFDAFYWRCKYGFNKIK